VVEPLFDHLSQAPGDYAEICDKLPIGPSAIGSLISFCSCELLSGTQFSTQNKRGRRQPAW
jgi:hypothetical protein